MTEDNIIKTYIPQLDNALGGGIRRGSGLGVYGALGLGKTILTMQMAYNNIANSRTCCFHSHDQSAEMLVDKMKGFGWDPEPYMDNFLIVDWYAILAPTEDEVEDATALTIEEALSRKLDLKTLLKRSNREMREKFGGHIPDLIVVDSVTPLFMQLGGRRLYLLLRMAKQMFLRRTASVVTIHSEIVDQREMNALSSLSNYFMKMEKTGKDFCCFNIEKSMKRIETPLIHYKITSEGIKPLPVKGIRTRV